AGAEAFVLAWLEPLAGGIEAQARAQRGRARTARKARGDAARQAAEETRLRGALARLLARQALDEDSPADAYDAARADLLGRREAARERLASARAAEARTGAPFIPVAAGLLQEWDTFPPAGRRELLSRLIARIEVHKTGYRKPPRLVIVPVWEA